MHRHPGIHDVRHGDVGIPEEEDHGGAGLDLAQGVLPGTALGVAAAGGIQARLRAPVFRVVPVEVQTTDPILVETTIPVAVDPLRDHHPLTLDVAAPGSPHEAPRRIPRVEGGVAVVLLPLSHPVAHLVDDTVSVQVLRRILVHETVAVVVHGAHRAPVRLGGVEVHGAAIGVVLWPQVDRLRIQQLRDPGVGAVAVQEVLHEPEHRLAARHLTAVPATLEVGGGLVGGGPRLLVGERRHEDGSPLEAPVDLVHVDEIGVLFLPSVEPFVHHFHGVVAVEGERLTGLVLHLRMMDEREVGDAVAVPLHRVPLGPLGPVSGLGGLAHLGGHQRRPNQEEDQGHQEPQARLGHE